MAVNVGELYAELRLDADQFTQGLQAGQQGLGSLSDAARRAAQVAQSSSDEQVRAYGRMRQAADQAARAVEQAHDRAGEAAERVRIAEERLEQARRDGGDVAQAQQRLVAAQRDQQRAAEQTTAAVERLEAANRRASTSAREIDFERVEREARQAAQATQQVDVPSGVAGRVRDIGSALGDLSGRVSSSAGSGAGSNFVSGFSDRIGHLASNTGPIAGSLLGVVALGLAAGAALAAAIEDGMSAEKNRDLFQAQTGVTEAQARKFGLAAGEAYADAYGESVEANLGTAKVALANGLLDPGATQQDAEKMISSLDGVATILGEDIPQVARAAGNAVKSGFAADTQDAFDLLIKGSQMGLNASEDLLDTIIEYSVQFEKVGLTGAQAFGLMNQAVQAGARDTDTAADAIKEFAIKSIDGSKAAAEAYQALGFNAEDMTAKIAQGGAEGAEGMAELLTRIRETEDPVVRNAVAVGLFGTKAEDLGNAMSALDLSTAVQSMNDYEGAASRAIAVMNGNAATSVEGAMRSISTIADSMKAALAEAFGPYIQEWADKVSNNRAGVVQFFLDVGNGAFEGARAILEFVSGGMRGLAEFADASTDMSVTFLRGLADMTSGMSAMGGLLGTLIPGLGPMLGGIGDISDKLNNLADAAEAGGNGVADGLRTGADFIDNTLVPGLDTVQNRFNEFGEGVKNSAGFNDALAKVDGTISKIGVGIDGAALKLEGFTGAIDRNNAAQVAMDNQLRGLVGSMQEQTRAGLEAGATVEQLTGNYHAQRDALLSQLMATGMSNKAALDYINSLGLVPDLVETQINQPGMPEAHHATDVLHEKVIGVPTSKEIHTTALTQDAIDDLTALGLRVEQLPDGTFRVFADTEEGETHLQNFINRERFATVKVKVHYDNLAAANDRIIAEAQAAAAPGGDGYVRYADGGIRMEKYADGGNKLPDGAVIQAPKARLVQWAEPETEGEAFIPLASSKRPRSLAILGEVARRFGMSLVDEGHARVREDIGRMFDPLTGWANLLAGDYDGRLAHSGIQEDDRIVAAVLGARSLLVDGDYTGNLLDAFGWQEDSPEVDALLGLQERDPEAVRRGLSAMAGRHVRGEFDRVFNGDPKSLTDADDPTGWRALLGGDYNGKLARFGIQEDHPLVAAVLGTRSFLVDGDYTANLHAGLGLHEDSAPVDIAFGVRNMLANGDYDGSLAKYGIQEDNPLTDVLLGAHKALYGQSFANGGVVEGLTALAAEKAPALQVTSSYRDTSDHHGSGKAVDFSNGSGNTDEMLAWANYLADNYQDQLLELIYDDPRFDRNIKNGKIVPRDFYAGAGDHTNHVHAAMSVPPQNVKVDERPKAIGADQLTSKQRNVDAVIAEGKRRGMSDQAIRAAVAATLAESDGENLANEADPESLKYPHDGLGSDTDSSGILQQRNNGAWGTAEDRMDPTRAAGMFYDQYAKVDGDSMSPEAAAQAVQRSAFSDGSNYAAKLAEADALIAESSQRSTLDTSSGFPTDSKTGMSTGGVQDVRVTNWPSSLLNPAPLPPTDQGGEPERKGHGFALAYYRNGGMEDHSAQIAPAGSWRVWAEEETGGEAYIPLAPSKRARSTSILRQVAHRFGMQLMADGSFMAPNDPAFDPGGSKHHDTVQAWLGTDAGGTASLSTIDAANPADVAAQNAYRAGVGIFGGAMALVDLIQGLMGGGVIGTGIDLAENIRKAIEDKAKEQAQAGGKPLGNPNPAPDATKVGAQFYGPVTITDPEGFIKDQLRQAQI